MRIACIIALALAAAVAAMASEAEPDAPAGGSSIKWLPDYHTEGHLKYYFNQKNDLYKERYVTEGGVAVEFDLLSANDRSFLYTDFELVVGMGESVAHNLPFSPMEMYYRFGPVAEHRSAGFLYRMGWDHACEHLIYKDNNDPWYNDEGREIEPDVFWNRILLALGTETIRPSAQREAYFSEAKRPNTLPSVVWYLEGGYYVRELFGMFDEDDLYEGDPEWLFDVKATIKVPLWRNKLFALCANNKLTVLADDGYGSYWREKIEGEVLFGKGGFGSSLFVGYTWVDEHPRDAKEDLVDLGLRFFY